MPSELLLTGRMTTATDVYSFGLMSEWARLASFVKMVAAVLYLQALSCPAGVVWNATYVPACMLWLSAYEGAALLGHAPSFSRRCVACPLAVAAAVAIARSVGAAHQPARV